jgi:hypothetical protein
VSRTLTLSRLAADEHPVAAALKTALSTSSPDSVDLSVRMLELVSVVQR